MSTSVRLPSELREFLSLQGPQSILLRGPPGSGKTTLSLALLEAFRGKKILVTCRVSTSELHREFPWLGEANSEGIEVVEANAAAGRVEEAAKAADRVTTLLSGSDEKEARALRAFLWLPQPLQDAWGRLSEEDPTLLVVDSWDALVEGYLGGAGAPRVALPDRGEIERLLLARMAQAPVHLVLVLEREEQTQLDYLVNGVVHAQIEFSEERLERWLYLRKLRGIRIANGMYPYTLEGGKFESIEPIRPYSELPTGRAEGEPDPIPGYLWPGSTDFAENLGRLPLGGLTVLELDREVPQAVPYLLFSPTVAHVASQGGPVLVLPDTRATPELLWKRVRPALSQRKYFDHVRFLWTKEPPGTSQPSVPDEYRRNLFLLDPASPEARSGAGPEIQAFLASGERVGAPSLTLVHLTGVDALANAFKVPIRDGAMSAFPSMLQTFTSGRQGHTIVVGRSGDHLLDALRPLASMHLHARLRQGRILLTGVSPWTPNFLVGAGQDHVPYQLLRVV